MLSQHDLGRLQILRAQKQAELKYAKKGREIANANSSDDTAHTNIGDSEECLRTVC